MRTTILVRRELRPGEALNQEAGLGWIRGIWELLLNRQPPARSIISPKLRLSWRRPESTGGAQLGTVGGPYLIPPGRHQEKIKDDE